MAANGVKPIQRRPKPANAIKPSPRRGSLPPKGQPLLRDRLTNAKDKAGGMKTRMARQSAREIAGRLKGGIDGMMSGVMQQNQGRRINAAANNVIRARAARATAAAARGSKPAARAREIYGAQLASTGVKGRKIGKNNIQPGPRNTTGKPKKQRKPRQPKGGGTGGSVKAGSSGGVSKGGSSKKGGDKPKPQPAAGKAVGMKKPPLPPPLPKPAAKPKAANNIAPSPRRLNAAEQAYMKIRAQKSKFRSDKKVREEMQRQGFLKGADPQGQLIMIASKARRKKGAKY